MPRPDRPPRPLFAFHRIAAAAALVVLLAPGIAAADPPLTTAGDLRRLSFAEANSKRPVRLEAVVTYFDAEWRLLFVQDATNGIFVDATEAELPPGLRIGQHVRVEGVSGPGQFAPVVARPQVTILGERPLPNERPATFADLDLGRLDSQRVEVAGVVRSARVVDAHLNLDLVVGPSRVEVQVPGVSDPAAGARLVDAAILCRGVCGSMFDGRRRWRGTRLFVQSLADVAVQKPPLADPFALAAVPIESLFHFDAVRDAGHRVKVAGVVTLQREPRSFFVQDPTGPAWVTADDPLTLRPGDRVEVAGFPAAGDRAPKLENARVRVLGRGEGPAAVDLTGDEAQQPENDGRLVRVEGRVMGHEARDGQHVVVLKADGKHVFEASFLDGAHDAGVAALPAGARVFMTGVLSVQGTGAGPQPFRLLPRSPGDVEIREPPPWWTRERAAALLGLFAAVAAVALVWGTWLRRQVRERMRNEADLEARYCGLVENASDVIFATDMAGCLTAFNKAGERLTGLDRREVLGRPVADLLVATSRDEAGGAAMRTDRTATIELELRGRAGKAVTVEVSTRPLMAEGKAVGLQGIARDVTERKRLDEQMRQAAKMEAIGRLAGGVAHDFNNLLTVVNGAADLLLAQLGPEADVRPLAEEIRQAGARAAALTQQLLAFGRRQLLPPEALDLPAIVRGLGPVLRRLAGEAVELTVACGPGPLRVKAAAGQVEQILVNLTVNARDAMPRGGRLAVRVEAATSGPVRLEVSDTGCGMDDRVRARIFEPFFTTKPFGAGTGLGLPTVYAIVQALGGRIDVRSEPGRGTDFRIDLPTTHEALPEVVPVAAPAPAAAGGSVLLVEDDESVRLLAQRILEMHGYEVCAASDGLEALEAAEQRNGAFHLLLTDVVMPRMSGREVAEEVARRWPAVKVLFMSGYTNDEVLRHGVLGDEINFLPKPFTPATLEGKVREVLANGGA